MKLKKKLMISGFFSALDITGHRHKVPYRRGSVGDYWHNTGCYISSAFDSTK